VREVQGRYRVGWADLADNFFAAHLDFGPGECKGAEMLQAGALMFGKAAAKRNCSSHHCGGSCGQKGVRYRVGTG
jgi:hypothetical protein